MNDAELDQLAPFVQPIILEEGEMFADLDAEAPGVLFIGGGFVSLTTRLPNGMLSHPQIVGRGRIFGEGAFSVIDPSVSAVPMRIVGVRKAECWVLPRANVAAAIQALPQFETALRRAIVLRSAIANFAQELRGTPILHDAPIPTLQGLVQNADLEQYAANSVILKEGTRTRGVFMMVKGTAKCSRKAESGLAQGTIREGMVFGGLRQGLSSEPETITATTDAICLRVGARLVSEQVCTSPALRRGVGRLPVFAKSHAQGASLVVVAGDKRYPLSKLAFLAAAELTASYPDACAYVRLLPEGRKAADPTVREGVRCFELAVNAGNVHERLSALRARLAEMDFIFLDPHEVPVPELLPIARILSRIVMVVSDTFVDPPASFRADKILWTVQLPDAKVHGDPPYQLGTVRVSLDMAKIQRANSLAEVSADDRARLQRWVRAISERTVGIALGGGGAWGFAHVALIEMMERNKIPIDMVSGASFGSLLGAFYCGLHGKEWKKTLFEAAGAANVATKTAFFSSKSLERVIDQHIERVAGRKLRLEELEVPLLPVATNVGLGSEAVIAAGTVGWGARCSSSFPGIFTPTTGRDFRYVDGGIVRNVPTDPLVWNGCDLIIASNIVPNPDYEKERPPRFPGRAGRWLHEFNLWRRAEDALRSALILMHTASSAVTSNADVLYNSPMVNYSPTNLNNGEAIMKAAQPSVKAIEPKVVNAWEGLRMGRN